MGLFDRFIKPKAENPGNYHLPPELIVPGADNPYFNMYAEHGPDNAVYLLYADFASAYKWVLDAVKPESYFSNYTKAIQLLEAINRYRGKYRFKSPTPDQQLHEIKTNYLTNTNNFIHRFWESNLGAAQKLKTENGKKKRIDQFYDTLLIRYAGFLLEENVDYINRFRSVDTGAPVGQTKIAVTCKKYDVNSLQGIRNIPDTDYSVMRVLQKCATNHKRNGDLNPAIECLKKSNAISDSSPGEKLTEKEYLRVLNYIKLTKDNDAYVSEETAIRRRHPEFWDKRISNRITIRKELQQYRRIGTNLVTVQTFPDCPICSQYKDIVFSLDSKNRKYPKLPDEVMNQTHGCTKHYMALLGFYEGISSLG